MNGLTINTNSYPLNPSNRPGMKSKEIAKSIYIGQGVWIGAGVIIGPGVNIGNGSVIDHGSVIISDVGENELWRGNPAKMIRNISQGEGDEQDWNA